MQFRVIVVTDPQSHKHTNTQTNRQHRLQYNAPLAIIAIINCRVSWCSADSLKYSWTKYLILIINQCIIFKETTLLIVTCDFIFHSFYRSFILLSHISMPHTVWITMLTRDLFAVANFFSVNTVRHRPMAIRSRPGFKLMTSFCRTYVTFLFPYIIHFVSSQRWKLISTPKRSRVTSNQFIRTCDSSIWRVFETQDS